MGYTKRTVQVSMNGYIEQALKEFKHNIPKQKHCGPSRMDRPNYRQKNQYAKVDHSLTLPPPKKSNSWNRSPEVFSFMSVQSIAP